MNGLLLNGSTQSSSFTPRQPTSDPKKGRTRQSGTAWTRSGCVTCKKRRKACDKTKPSCNNCLKQGRTCEGYGSIWVEPLSPSAQVFSQTETSKRRRLSASSPSQFSSPAPSPSSGAWVKTRSSPAPGTSLGWSVPSSPWEYVPFEAAVIPFQDVEEYSPGPDIDLQSSVAMIPQHLGYTSHLSTHETHYLQYHMEQGSRLLANLESHDNPLRSTLIPRAMSSPLLMKAVCAISALHLANRSQGFGAHTAAVKYYSGTLNGLRTALDRFSAELFPDDAMLAVGLLCKYEIVRGSVKQWVVHLNALQRLIVSRGGFASMDRDAAEFLRGLFVYAHYMARICNHNCITCMDFSVDSDIGIPKLDIYIGYTEEILKLCARIAKLPSLQVDTLALRLSVASINESLLTWSHTSIPYIIPQGTSPATITRLQLVAECFRDAGFVYLHSIMERISRVYPDTSPTVGPGTTVNTQLEEIPSLSALDWVPLISTPKSVAVYRCLGRIETFPLGDHCEYSALTFPLFISGCESDNVLDREIVLRSLGKLQDNFGIGNVRRAKELLGFLWARQDANFDAQCVGMGEQKNVHWLDIVEELGWELILA
ncbi:Fungal transcriptional regulatory protein, N-terminal [Penicillium digitatum]|uniref:Fungal transcriptional regulatory protein, N-terminal n=1 Tax=Penicillium digitatum TaxID=36651 RepID=A0A7T6XFW4_PENDI|nr:Fungal transcriptional regulatory protein, N-terminal [Penicillium digitatum]